jgi:hypothetical protein
MSAQKTLQEQTDSIFKKGKYSPLQKDYLNYFKLNREVVFLHLNKTAVIPGEGVFFSAYSYDPRLAKANKQTTNLNLDVYDGSGKRVGTKTIYMKNGFGNGAFKLDPKQYKPGDYLVTASTNYMKNFHEDLEFSQRFRILDTVVKNQKKTSQNHDLQLLPEGGNLLTNVSNNVGVKLIDGSGRGVFFTEAQLRDDRGNIITKINSNRFGMARFTFTPKPRKSYKVRLRTNSGKLVSKKLPKAERRGIATSVNALLPENVFLSVRTNYRTFQSSKKKSYILAIHRQGLLRQIEFQIPEGPLEKTLRIDRNLLLPGINILTVFENGKQLKPLAERMVFNSEDLKRVKVNAKKKTSGVNRGKVHLFSKDLPEKHNLSVSVLPFENESYKPDHSILSSFYLKPFLKGSIENGGYYFKRGKDRRRAYDLDLLLMTQGWSKFDWNRIFNYPPTEKFEAKQGFNLRGTMQGKNARDPENSMIILKGSSDNLLEYAELDKNNSFEFNNVYLEDTTQISVGLVNKKTEKVEKPDGLYLQVFPVRNDSTLKEFDPIAFETSNLKVQTSAAVPPNFAPTAEELDTVIIDGQTEREQERARSITSQKTYIDKDMAQMFNYITDYIQARGFRVQRSLGRVQIASPRAMSLRGMGSPSIIIDGVIASGSSSTILYNQTTKQVESISINKTGAGAGLRGSAGVIKIETRTDQLYGNKKKRSNVQQVLVSNGYASGKEFYRPEYIDYQSDFFEKYGVINWYPEIKLNESGQGYIEVFNTLRPKVKLYIEGMAQDGTLVSEEVIVNMRER